MTARIPTWRVALALLLGATILPVAHANDTYRYKDPFGRWRTMHMIEDRPAAGEPPDTGLGVPRQRAQLLPEPPNS